MKPTLLTLSVSALFAPAAFAAEPEQYIELDTITVTADRAAQKLDQAAPNVAVVTRRTLNQASAADLDDALMYEAGVGVPSDNNRRGHAGVNIRGIGGNRILMMVDGVRIPESYAGGGGNGAISGRDLTEPDTLKQIDIVKGPYSALYGSDALGGVVNMATYSPSDFVDEDKRSHFGLKYGYQSRERGHGLTATAAAFHENAEGLLMLTGRRSHEMNNMGSDKSRSTARTANNPQNTGSHNILAKGNIGNEQHRAEAVFEQFYRATDTDLAGSLGISRTATPRGTVVTNTTLAEARDRARRQRIELGYRFRGENALKEASVRAYRQHLQAEDDGVSRTATTVNGRTTDATRYTDYGFNQTISGLNGQTEFGLQTGGIAHRIVAGAEYKQTETERPRDSLTLDHNTGATSKMSSDGLYPNKTFPDSTRQTLSLYAQNSLTFANGIVLTPALRFEQDKLTPKIDQAYLNANPNGNAASFRDRALTPSLRLSVPMDERFTGFAGYSQGFRTPPFDSATMAFANTARGYAVVPNHKLKSERSHSFETGLKYRNDSTRAQITAFYNRYKDFIDRTQTGSSSVNGRPVMLFQFQNLDGVKTYGAEASASHKLNEQWRINGSIAWMKGQRQNGTPLDTAHPLHGTLGAEYKQEKWGAHTQLRWAKKQNRVSSSQVFRTPGYGVWDIGAWYKPLKNLEIGATVYNVGNKKYWQHADVAGLSQADVSDLHTASGRNVAASLKLTF